jgi:hypothetical protein
MVSTRRDPGGVSIEAVEKTQAASQAAGRAKTGRGRARDGRRRLATVRGASCSGAVPDDADDELADLAEDIKVNGLLHPIVNRGKTDAALF